MYRIVRIDNRKYLVSYCGKAEAVGQAVQKGQKVTKNSFIEIGDYLKSDEEIMEALDIYRNKYGETLSVEYRSESP